MQWGSLKKCLLGNIDKNNRYQESIRRVVSSETFQRLNDPACGLYYKSAVYVFSYLQNEIEQGVLK